jgi:cardiolipin synthase A/B
MTGRNPYPEREGNDFRLLTTAGDFLAAMELAIYRARHYVLFEQYLISSGQVADRFIAAFAECVHRGVPVYMLLDHFGARGLSTADRRRIEQAGIALVFYNPAYFRHFFRGLPRNHCKVLIIDGELAYTGGAGITDDYREGGHGLPWHDAMVEMRGPVVGDWQMLFVHTWRRWAGEISLPKMAMKQSGEQLGQLVPSLRGMRKYIRRSLLAHIRHASDRAWLATAYWLPGRVMLRALRAAKRRGVEVRLLLPGPINDHPTVYHAGRRYYHFLLRHGIRIFEYQPAFMHAKLYLCDGWCSIGSCNMDRWGLRWNLEANLESDDTDLCSEVEDFFRTGFAHCREITLDAWRARPAGSRFREWLFGYIDLMIERYGVNRELRRKTAIPKATTENKNHKRHGP